MSMMTVSVDWSLDGESFGFVVETRSFVATLLFVVCLDVRGTVGTTSASPVSFSLVTFDTS